MSSRSNLEVRLPETSTWLPLSLLSSPQSQSLPASLSVSCSGAPAFSLTAPAPHSFLFCHLQMPGWHITVILSLQWRTTVSQHSAITPYCLGGHRRSYISNDIGSMFVCVCIEVVENKEVRCLFIFMHVLGESNTTFAFCSFETVSWGQTGSELTLYLGMTLNFYFKKIASVCTVCVLWMGLRLLRVAASTFTHWATFLTWLCLSFWLSHLHLSRLGLQVCPPCIVHNTCA